MITRKKNGTIMTDKSLEYLYSKSLVSHKNRMLNKEDVNFLNYQYYLESLKEKEKNERS